MGCCAGKENVHVDRNTVDHTDTTPRRERKCRDCIFLILFICALGGAGYLSYVAIKRGDPQRYISGSDSWGNVCGRSNNTPIANVSISGRNMSEYKYEFYTALSDIKMVLDPMQYVNMKSGPAVLCVKKCPNETAVFCKDLLDENEYSLSDDIINRRVCKMPGGLILPHTNILNRCVPSVFVNLGNAVSQAGAAVVAPGLPPNITEIEGFDNSMATGLELPGSEDAKKASGTGMSMVLHQVLSSIASYWKEVVYLTLISIVVSLMTLIFLQLFTRILVVAIIVTAATGTVATTAYLWYTYVVSIGIVEHEKGALANAIPAGRGIGLSSYEIELRQFIEDHPVELKQMQSRMAGVGRMNVSSAVGGIGVHSMAQMKHLLPMAIASTVIMIVVLILLVWVRKSLCLVISLFDEASMAVFSMPGMLLQPVKTVLQLISFTIWFLIIAAYIYSSQIPKLDNDGLVRWVENPEFRSMVMILPHLFMYFWLVQFFYACQEIILAGAVANWFFSKGVKQTKCKCNMCATVRPSIDLLLYNLGSAALGSLIIAIVWMIRTILGYIQSKLKKSDNKMAKRILRCMQCILACFEKVLKYINRNAYIAIAMYGDGFCGGAKRALSLLVSNAQHMMAINCVGGFCLLLGKVAVTVETGFIGLTWFTMLGVSQEQYLAPLIISCIGSFIIASCFFAVFGISLDTIFLCFCDDQQRNNGHDRPYYSSEFLQRYMSTGVVDNRSNGKTKRQSVAQQKSTTDQPLTSAGPTHLYPKLPVTKKEFQQNLRMQKSSKRSDKHIFRRIFHGGARVNNGSMGFMRQQPMSDVGHPQRSDQTVESAPFQMTSLPLSGLRRYT